MTDNLSLADNQLQEPVQEQIQEEEQERLYKEQIQEEEEQERLYKEHQAYLDSFPSDSLFYDHIVEKDGLKYLDQWLSDPRTAESLGLLENHISYSECSYIKGTMYLKGYEPVIDPEEEKKIALNQKIVQIKNAVQKLINDTAASRDYDDGFTCVSYFNSTDEKFKAEARAFNYWRDQLWRKCYEILDDVLAGKIDSEQVNVDYVLNLLPEIEW